MFLLSRIKEARDDGAADSDAVAIGLERTGRIVTAAALLFAVAIGAFATSQLVFIKELGLGAALAVLIDASIIRALLVPVADGAARQVELVGAGAAAAAARADRSDRARASPHRRRQPATVLNVTSPVREGETDHSPSCQLTRVPSASRAVARPNRGTPHSVATSGRSDSGTSPSPRATCSAG